MWYVLKEEPTVLKNWKGYEWGRTKCDSVSYVFRLSHQVNDGDLY